MQITLGNYSPSSKIFREDPLKGADSNPSRCLPTGSSRSMGRCLTIRFANGVHWQTSTLRPITEVGRRFLNFNASGSFRSDYSCLQYEHTRNCQSLHLCTTSLTY